MQAGYRLSIVYYAVSILESLSSKQFFKILKSNSNSNLVTKLPIHYLIVHVVSIQISYIFLGCKLQYKK